MAKKKKKQLKFHEWLMKINKSSVKVSELILKIKRNK